jgi:hypothetical protein
MGRLLYTLRALRAGRPVPARGVKLLLEKAPGKRERRMMDGSPVVWQNIDLDTDGFESPMVWKAFAEAKTVMQVIGLLDLSERAKTQLKAALGRTDSIDPTDVKIGTMHSAKGLEAPCVYLFPESTPKVLEEYRTGDAGEEHRLHYVGVTRASETLHVVRDFFGTEVFPPFELSTPYDPSEVVA